MYESVIDLVSGEATMLFVPLTYTLATEEAERIGVDHVARMCSNDQVESSLGNFREIDRKKIDKSGVIFLVLFSHRYKLRKYAQVTMQCKQRSTK